MASLRAIRRSSRMSSPMDTSTRDSLPVKKEAQTFKEQGSVLGQWIEPPLRAPAPSFEDYKGLERHGVLEHMAPLGTLPSQKVKLRLRAYDPPRRAIQVKNGDPVTTEKVNTPEPTVPLLFRRSEPRKVDDRLPKLSSSREREDDQDYKPKSTPKAAASKAIPPPSPLGTLNLHLTSPQVRLKEIVNSAVARSRHLGNPVLGLAIKKLWEESLNNRTLAELLNSVLSGKTTPQQQSNFQAYIKIARKHIKAEKRRNSHSSSNLSLPANFASKSPSKSARLSVARQFGSPKDDLSEATGTNKIQNPNSKPPTPKQHTKIMEPNGVTLKEERPTKRVKRSTSASSSSSLSSLSSVSIDQDFVPSPEIGQATIHASAQPMTKSSMPQSAHGPKLHHNPTTSVPKRSTNGSCSSLDISVEESAAKRRKLQKTFEDFTVTESGMRIAPALSRQSKLNFSIAPTQLSPSTVQQQQQQQRLRNGITRRGNRDELSGFHSPASSIPRDLVVRPAVDARILSRSGTPNQLGRPPRKGARVKISPTKKRTAGTAQAVQTDNTSEGPIGDGQENGGHWNYEVCSACGYAGALICCDTCPQAFHSFDCLEMPVDPDTHEGEWHCNTCLERANPSPVEDIGDATTMASQLKTINTKRYLLNSETRNYFEGVQTTNTVEGDEIVEFDVYADDSLAAKKKTRGGYEEMADNLKLKDGKENVILCHQCGLSSMGGREIIDCDLCRAYWHLDCLDPPMAKKPRAKLKGNWTCPIHLEFDMTETYVPKPDFGDNTVETATFIGPQFHNANELYGTTSLLPPAPERALPDEVDPGRELKVHRPKIRKSRKHIHSHHHRNNGLLDIENDPTDDEDPYNTRTPEKGIKLDFIDRLKRSASYSNAADYRRTVREQEAKIRRQERLISSLKLELRSVVANDDNSPSSHRSPADEAAAQTLADLAQAAPV